MTTERTRVTTSRDGVLASQHALTDDELRRVVKQRAVSEEQRQAAQGWLDGACVLDGDLPSSLGGES